ncbi:MAG: hypothetical protein HYY24_21510 [Verrucomicrobia bacterium]|nr:hypothetical protein [Verrucomicrobiota bacterium]
MKDWPANKITGANAGGPRQLPIRTRWAARVAQSCRWAAMLRLPPSLLIASLLAALPGCTGGADTRRGYDSESGDLGAFILRMAPQYGVRILTTNGLPAIPAKWRFKADSNEFSLVLAGDYFPQLHPFLSRAVGPPFGSPTTNSPGELPGITAYYGTNFGVTMSCGSGKDDDGKQYTSFAIVNYGAASAGAGALSATQFWQLFREVVSELEKNPLKEFECHDEAVEHAVDTLTFPKEVETLFGATNVDHFIRPFTGAAVWNSAAYFAGRYTLELRVPIAIDYEHCRVKDVLGSVEVEIREVIKVDFYGRSGAPGATLKGYWRLNENEWRSLVKNGGNWSVVNVPIVSNAPVKGFDAYANSVRDPIRYRKENFDRPVREAWEALRKRGTKTNTTPDPEKQNR